MKLKIKYFGLLAEITYCDEEAFEFSGLMVSELREILYVKYPDLIKKNFQIAQNQILVSDQTVITGDEIALLPPFAGG
jgi:molybdopterin synthase sulfur carrier subunit